MLSTTEVTMNKQRDIIESMGHFIERDYERDYIAVTLVLQSHLGGPREEYTFSFNYFKVAGEFGGRNHNAFVPWLVKKVKQQLAEIWEAQT